MFFKHFFNHRIYLDYASSTPIDYAVHRSFPRLFGSTIAANPSALHKEGVRARKTINDARAVVAKVLNAHADEIIYTSGATESDNLALIGSIEALLLQGIRLPEIAIISSSVEHAAVTETIASYVAQGIFSITLPFEQGIIDPKHIVVPEQCRAVIVSVMYVNNEIGTVQPIKEIAKRIRKLRKDHPAVSIIFHTDATQAPLHYNLRVDQLGVDLMTLGATKLYTHRGVGVLYKKRNVVLASITRGGGQESGLRPGTEPIELVHGFAHALKYAQEIKEAETKRIKELQMYFESRITAEIPRGIITAKDRDRTPHITHVAIKDFDSELLVIELDAKGVAVSAKSACKNEEDRESEIVETLYGTGYGAARFSFGRMTTKRELDRAIQALKEVIEKYTEH